MKLLIAILFIITCLLTALSLAASSFSSTVPGADVCDPKIAVTPIVCYHDEVDVEVGCEVILRDSAGGDTHFVYEGRVSYLDVGEGYGYIELDGRRGRAGTGRLKAQTTAPPFEIEDVRCP